MVLNFVSPPLLFQEVFNESMLVCLEPWKKKRVKRTISLSILVFSYPFNKIIVETIFWGKSKTAFVDFNRNFVKACAFVPRNLCVRYVFVGYEYGG